MKRMRELAGIDSVRPTLGESFSAPSVPFYAHFAHKPGSSVDEAWVYAYAQNKAGSFKCLEVTWPLGKTSAKKPKQAVKKNVDFRGIWASGWEVVTEKDLPPEVEFRFKPAVADLTKETAKEPEVSQTSKKEDTDMDMKRMRELAGVDSVRPGLSGTTELSEVKTPQVPALHGMTPLGLPMAKPDKAPKKLKGKALDKEIEKSYYKLGHGVQIDIMDISKVFKMGQASYEKDGDIEAGLAAAIKQFRKN